MLSLLLTVVASAPILRFFAPQAAAVVPATTFRVDVRQLGAVGDGSADDGPAIQKAVDTITQNGGGTLYFPRGIYRCMRTKETVDGVGFVGVSNVTINFDLGAVLLMDNLNEKTGVGDKGHGVKFRGPASNIHLINVAVKWAKASSKRSQGDGFRFEGFPDDSRTLANIIMENCSAEQCPQAGAVFHGCSDVMVKDFRATQTLADGLHFNACRRITVDGFVGETNGDDGLAFVTYGPLSEPDPPFGPFSQQALGPWSDTGSNVSRVKITGGRADGIRISGAKDVQVRDAEVTGKSGCGVIIDSARKEPPKLQWTYIASRGIKISRVNVKDCDTGVLVKNHNVPIKEDAWSHFDVTLTSIRVIHCRRNIDVSALSTGVQQR